MKQAYLVVLTIALSAVCLGNPYPDENAVPREPPSPPGIQHPTQPLLTKGKEVLRVDVTWTEAQDRFQISRIVKESSGTEALLKRSGKQDALGSFQGMLVDNGAPYAFSSVGTGKELRYLSRGMTFRFPVPRKSVVFRMLAENIKTAKMEEVISQSIDPSQSAMVAALAVETKVIRKAKIEPPLVLTVYAEGYAETKRDQFWLDADRLVSALETKSFPGQDRFEIRGVFLASNTKLGAPSNLGSPVAERDSFLSLYYPYWHNFGRWYNVVYPTRESRMRDAMGQVAYDYPIALIDDSHYWGVGNFNELTAVPAHHSSFTYLLTHEFGHYFGLNEEYEGGGPTELAFAPGIEEPWSQNNTFLKDPAHLKWAKYVDPSTPIPTPESEWTGNGPIGAYKGGYADTEPQGQSHKPVFSCVMTSGSNFCPVCSHAIEEKVAFDLGESKVRAPRSLSLR